MKERFGAADESCRLRFHAQTGGVTLTAQQPLNNVVRVTVQTLAATLGGTQSLHTNGYDEALSLPTAEAATLALRTQQIVGHESGITNTVDPLAGSYYVEALTTELERRANALIAKVDERGGAARAIEAGFFQEEIARSAYEHQLRVESGETVVVGVNRFTEPGDTLRIPTPDFTALELGQIRRLALLRASRDEKAVITALTALREAALGYRDQESAGARVPLLPRIIDAVRARVTVGEISDCLRGEWGTYQPR
jgi:methylmalonyl-CoA mutase N-terminal domain/subunit